METLTLITNALVSIGVVDVNSAPSAEAGAHALGNLNRLMASLAEDDIDLGYAPTTDITDDIALPLGTEETIQAMLALREASDRGIEPPAMVSGLAASGYTRLLRQSLLLSQRSASLATVSHGTGSYDLYNIEQGC
jgi:P22 tail accessory factor